MHVAGVVTDAAKFGYLQWLKRLGRDQSVNRNFGFRD